MSTIDKIKEDQMTARKNRDEVRASLLTTLYSDIVMRAKNDKNRAVTEDDVQKVVKSFMDKLIENKNIYERAGKAEAVEKVMLELSVLAPYKAQEVSEEVLKVAIDEIGSRYPKENASRGKIMGELKVKFGNSMNGAMAATLVGKYLSG